MEQEIKYKTKQEIQHIYNAACEECNVFPRDIIWRGGNVEEPFDAIAVFNYTKQPSKSGPHRKGHCIFTHHQSWVTFYLWSKAAALTSLHDKLVQRVMKTIESAKERDLW